MSGEWEGGKGSDNRISDRKAWDDSEYWVNLEKRKKLEKEEKDAREKKMEQV